MFWSWILNDDYYHYYHHTCHHNHPFNSSSKLWWSTGSLVLVPISILVLGIFIVSGRLLCWPATATGVHFSMIIIMFLSSSHHGMFIAWPDQTLRFIDDNDDDNDDNDENYESDSLSVGWSYSSQPLRFTTFIIIIITTFIIIISSSIFINIDIVIIINDVFNSGSWIICSIFMNQESRDEEIIQSLTLHRLHMGPFF